VTSHWKPSIYVWPFIGAPAEFRRLSPFGSGEEAVVYVPPELLDEDDMVRIDASPLWFLMWDGQALEGRLIYSTGWGACSLHRLAHRALVAITADSERDIRASQPHESTGRPGVK
jgi:hypothetical protein